MFGIIEQSGDLAKARAELIGNVAPGLSGGLAIGLDEDLPNCGRDDTLLAFACPSPTEFQASLGFQIRSGFSFMFSSGSAPKSFDPEPVPRQ